MQTKELYYQDIYLVEFEAEVISCTKRNDLYEIILNQTAFYPESGGMLCDCGYLNNVYVEKVIKDNDNIIHLTKQEIKEKDVKAKVDLAYRLDNIQTHDAQHLLSAILEKDYHLVTVSHHANDKYCDLILEGDILNDDIIKELEIKANKMIFDDNKIDIVEVKKEELNKYGIDYNDKYGDIVRIVNIEKLNDMNACGCLHFNSLAKIQAVKCFGYELNKKQYRLIFASGNRLLNILDNLNNIFKVLKVSLKANEENIIDKTNKLIDRNLDLSRQLGSIKAELYAYKLNDLIKDSSDNFIVYSSESDTLDDLRLLANKVINHEEDIIAYLQCKKDDSYQFILTKQNESKFDLQGLFNKLKEIYHVNGGGKQTTINGQSEIDLSTRIKEYF